MLLLRLFWVRNRCYHNYARTLANAEAEFVLAPISFMYAALILVYDEGALDATAIPALQKEDGIWYGSMCCGELVAQTLNLSVGLVSAG